MFLCWNLSITDVLYYLKYSIAISKSQGLGSDEYISIYLTLITPRTVPSIAGRINSSTHSKYHENLYRHSLHIIHRVSSRVLTHLKIINASIQSLVFMFLLSVSTSLILLFTYSFYLFLYHIYAYTFYPIKTNSMKQTSPWELIIFQSANKFPFSRGSHRFITVFTEQAVGPNPNQLILVRILFLWEHLYPLSLFLKK